MNSWISKISGYLNKFLELGVLLLGVSVIAEILFGPNVAFFGSQVTNNLINLLNSLGEQGVAALIIVFAVTLLDHNPPVLMLSIRDSQYSAKLWTVILFLIMV